MPRLAIVLSLALLACAPVGADLRVAGSDLIRPSLEPAAARYTKATGQKVLLQLEGSYPVGLDALLADRADVAFLAVPAERAGALGQMRRLPLAYAVAYLVVSDSNPVSVLSFDQISGIYGSDDAKRVVRWADVGAPADWATRGLTPQTVSDRTAPAVWVALAQVQPGGRPGPIVSFHESPDTLFRAIMADEKVLGLSPVAPPPGLSLRVLQVSSAKGDPGFLPTVENVYAGDYRLRLPVEVVFKAEKLPELRAFLRSLYAADGIDLTASYLAKLPDDVREQVRSELEP